jgi:3-isopropylmalate/(R)-2-methylmalate dehydratase small subunit
LKSSKGNAWKVGDNVDTDQIVAGRYLSLTDPEELGSHCFEGAYPELAEGFAEGDILFAGENFGCGSSREHAVVALKALGVSCIVANSFARIFFRNCINLGLLPVECPGAAASIDEGDEVSLDAETGKIEDLTKGLLFEFDPMQPFLDEILAAGDLTSYVQKRLAEGHAG